MTLPTGTKITLIDYKRPLRKRLEARKVAGPYYFTVPPVSPIGGNGAAGFYCASTQTGRALHMDEHGSPLRLRIEEAPATRRGVTGYYADEDTIISPIIARLPKSRGFLAGATMGAGMASWLEEGIILDEHDAHMRAHDYAERMAENEREYQERENERIREEEAQAERELGDELVEFAEAIS